MNRDFKERKENCTRKIAKSNHILYVLRCLYIITVEHEKTHTDTIECSYRNDLSIGGNTRQTYIQIIYIYIQIQIYDHE